MATTELTDAEIIKMADLCANRSDHNQSGETSSHAELLEMVEEGMSMLAKNKVFTDYMRKISVAN
ncbi:hypothetical protein ACYULU_15560 [Breznakiellaceae bacterium SP9]